MHLLALEILEVAQLLLADGLRDVCVCVRNERLPSRGRAQERRGGARVGACGCRPSRRLHGVLYERRRVLESESAVRVELELRGGGWRAECAAGGRGEGGRAAADGDADERRIVDERAALVLKTSCYCGGGSGRADTLLLLLVRLRLRSNR